MTSNFRDFVNCYRCQDSIGTSDGYQTFAPVWKMNCQNKHLQCWAEQLHQTNKKHKYSLVRNHRCHRSHKSYPGDTGKSCTAQGEYIEVKNCDLSLLPQTRSIAGYMQQGSMIGACGRSKYFNESIWSTGVLEDCAIHRKSTNSKNNQTPEKNDRFTRLRVSYFTTPEPSRAR